MKTVDLRKRHRALYQASSKAPQLVEVPELPFLSIDGRIEPGRARGPLRRSRPRSRRSTARRIP